MKKLLFSLLGTTIVSIALVVYSTHAFADDKQINLGQGDDDNNNERLFNPGNELSKAKCTNATGKPIIKVTQKVQNDADSGAAGNYWAFDYYTRHITVWKTTTENTYCGIVTYDGKFYAIPGQAGPGSTITGPFINTPANEPINGELSGGRRVTITGTLLATPLWPTHGSVGTTNYQCNISGDCPGIVRWQGQYFNPGYTSPDNWWGWKYKAGSHGTWINAITGNSGNIL